MTELAKRFSLEQTGSTQLENASGAENKSYVTSVKMMNPTHGKRIILFQKTISKIIA